MFTKVRNKIRKTGSIKETRIVLNVDPYEIRLAFKTILIYTFFLGAVLRFLGVIVTSYTDKLFLYKNLHRLYSSTLSTGFLDTPRRALTAPKN